MRHFLQSQKTSLLLVGVVVTLFVGATVLAQTYSENLEDYLAVAGWRGMLVYIMVTALGTVLAPISTVPLIPIVAQSWGWILTGTLSVLGWVIGSQIAFLLARQYGVHFVSRFVSLEKIKKFEASFSSEHIFWTVVLLRLIVPVDVLSYALGLFSTMSVRSYLFATLIGVTPFAFIFSYTGTLAPGLQIIVVLELLFFLLIVYYIRNRFSK